MNIPLGTGFDTHNNNWRFAPTAELPGAASSLQTKRSYQSASKPLPFAIICIAIFHGKRKQGFGDQFPKFFQPPVQGLYLAYLAREHVLLAGPTGTAKHLGPKVQNLNDDAHDGDFLRFFFRET